METIKYKYIFYFCKKNWLIFISHLNLMKLFERSFTRSGLPLCYTQGFNPHLRLSIPFPLSLGQVGRREIGEIYLDKKVSPAEFLEKVNKYLPEDIQLLEVEHKNIKSLSQFVNSYDYEIVFKHRKSAEQCFEKVNIGDLILQKTTKTGNTIDFAVKDYIKEIKLNESKLMLELLVKDQRSLDVEKLLKACKIEMSDIEDIIRCNINCAIV